MEYYDFIKSKQEKVSQSGFEAINLNEKLFDFQKYIVKFACKTGKSAIFANTGMGKTIMQLEWAKQVAEFTKGNVIIIAPLAICHQTSETEANKFGYECHYIPDGKPKGSINIINYERLEHVNPNDFNGVALDESSVLKNFTGSTKRELIKKFKNTPYKSCYSATPAPNDFLELGNHAEFLDIMASNEMISRFFINDTMEAGSYRLKAHAEHLFWQWMASWSVCITNPSDLGFDGSNFILPNLNIVKHVVDTTDIPADDGELFRSIELSATNIHKEKKKTCTKKADQLSELVNNSDERWVVWCETNYEADVLKEKIKDHIEVRGSESPELKAKKLIGFSNAEYKNIITKPSLAGYGLNWQNCHNMAFIGLSYSYEMYYQSIRRCYRFGQDKDVNVHIFVSDTEQGIFDVITKKEKEHKRMQNEMSKVISAYHAQRYNEIKNNVKIMQGNNWELWNSDCYEHCKTFKDGQIDFSVYSPPFENLYIYSDSPFDMGNSSDSKEFFEHYKFLVKELFRATRNGRLTAIHCKDLPMYKNRDGAAGLRDFPGEIIRMYEECGWTYHSRVTIWKDPVIEMQRTKNHGLLYKQLLQNSAASRQGMADYMIVMRKNVEGIPDKELENPVKRETKERFYDYIGSSMFAPAKEEISRGRDLNEKQRLYSIAVWQRYASPVWFDIQQTNVLNGKIARDGKDERHICPLQIGIIERSIELWSNPGDLVYSPFSGIGSEGYVAVKMNRRFVGSELKESYWNQACIYISEAEKEKGQEDLFSRTEEIVG